MKMLFFRPEQEEEKGKTRNFLPPCRLAAPHRNFPISPLKCFYARAMYLYLCWVFPLLLFGIPFECFWMEKKVCSQTFFVLGFYRFFLAMRYARPFRFPWKIIMDFLRGTFCRIIWRLLGGFFFPSTSLCLPGGILFAFLLNWRLRRLFSPTSPSLLASLSCVSGVFYLRFCWTSLTRSRSIFVFKGRKLPNESWRGLKGNSFKRLQERFLKSRNFDSNVDSILMSSFYSKRITHEWQDWSKTLARPF